jgi:putative acetyltransferase
VLVTIGYSVVLFGVMSRVGFVLIRREVAGDVDVVRGVVEEAFAFQPRGEWQLLDQLREDPGWIPALSFVALVSGRVVGHVVCTRGAVGDAPALGLGPLSVLPAFQGVGVGKALMHTVLGAADALEEPLVALLGDPGYYSRFGFVLSESVGVVPPVLEWGPYFQVRVLSGYRGDEGEFRYADPFGRM